MTLLIASLVALFIGPALIHTVGRRPTLMDGVDAFVVVAIGGLVFFHILPDTVADAGWLALLAALVGTVIPELVHTPLDTCDGKSTRPLLGAAVLAIAIHAFFDGVGLVGRGDVGWASPLALAVVLHRVLEGSAIWWLVRPHYGRRGTLLMVSIIASATTAGYFGAGYATHAGSERIIALIQATVAGSLLHVLLRHAPVTTGAKNSKLQWSSALGGIAAMAFLAGLSALPEDAHEMAGGMGPGDIFWALAWRAAPALLVAYTLVACFHAIAPAGLRSLTGRGSAWLQAARGTFHGLAVAVCSCGVIPLYRTLVADKAPPRAALAFLVAAPALGFAGLLLSVTFLGLELAIWRTAAAAGIAMWVGLWVGRDIAEPSPNEPHAPTGHMRAAPRQALRHRFVDGAQFALGEVLDHSGPWLLFGLTLAGFVETAVQSSWLAKLEALHLDVLVLTLLGAPIYLSASAATLIGAVLLSKGASAGAGLAFVLSSSATCLTTARFIKRAHGNKVAWKFNAAVVLGALAAGHVMNAFCAGPVHVVVDPAQQPSPLQMIAAAVLGFFILCSLFRQGVRPFFAQVAAPNTLGSHSHHHDHAEQHGHSHSI